MLMKQISIPVDPYIASAYAKATPQVRKKAEILVNFWLKELFVNKEKAKKELFETMDRIGAIAQANGLTPAILERLLNEED